MANNTTVELSTLDDHKIDILDDHKIDTLDDHKIDITCNIVLIISCVVATCANTFVMTLILAVSRLHTPNNVFVVSLCLCNLMFSIIVIPMRVFAMTEGLYYFNLLMFIVHNIYGFFWHFFLPQPGRSKRIYVRFISYKTIFLPYQAFTLLLSKISNFKVKTIVSFSKVLIELLFDIGVEGQTNKHFSFRIFEPLFVKQQLIPWQPNEDVN